MAAYLGREGYCLEMELREGKQHCQKDTPAFLQRNLVRARSLTDESYRELQQALLEKLSELGHRAV
ncbi:MAG: hypothetical protein KDH88_02470 [Chromatiales bacterium]|nr:hypothetical protein [Chromatiales bacterium]